MPLYLKKLTWNADTSAFGLDTSHFLGGSGATVSNASVDVGCFHHDFGSSRNPAPPLSFQNNQTQTARGIQSNYSQRSTPTIRASSSLRMGHVTSLDEGLPMVAESYSSRHPRPLSTHGWRNGDRNGRSRISSQRYRSLTEESGLAERFASEVSFASISRNSFSCVSINGKIYLYNIWNFDDMFMLVHQCWRSIYDKIISKLH